MARKPKTTMNRKKWIWWVLGIFLVLGLIGSLGEENSNKSAIRVADSVASVTLDSEGGTYVGPAVDYVYEGSGSFQYIAGGAYEGDFSESKRSGNGTFRFDNGDAYTGTWENDNMLEGTYTFADGRTYIGTFDGNQFDSGTFKVVSFPDELAYTSFSATYKSGIITSIQLELEDGSYYRGDLTGKADARYPSGNTYSGEVKDGKRSGTGTFTWYDNGVKAASYTGGWSNDLMSGKGKYYYTASSYPYLEGTFQNGLVTGTATYYKEAGNAFSTTWVNGKCTGVTEI